MDLSIRLQAVADLVSEGLVIADVGTDHGYIPIYLVETKKIRRAIAMDVNKGPLLRAKEHISAAGYTGQIECRLSDGVSALQPGECDGVVIAGMGGALTIRILEAGKEVFQELREFVLQPQSELQKVREYLCQNAYCIVEENMVLDDGKFYPMFRVINQASPAYDTIELRYGKLLLEGKNPVLQEFLRKEQDVKEQILEQLKQSFGEHIEARRKEIEEELEGIRYALQRYYEGD